MKLIIIDDQPIQHFIIQRMIKVYLPFKPTVDCYVDATLVIEYLNANKNNNDELPDIIIVDLHMNLMSGHEFLNKFAGLRNDLIKSILVYIVSSSIDPVDIALSEKYDFVSNYLIKPVTKSAFQSIFENF